LRVSGFRFSQRGAVIQGPSPGDDRIKVTNGHRPMITSAPSVAPAASRVPESEIKTIVVRGGFVRGPDRALLEKISTGKASSQKSVPSGVQTRALLRSAALVPGLQTYTARVPSALNRWRRSAPRNQANATSSRAIASAAVSEGRTEICLVSGGAERDCFRTRRLRA
jgi:hypothetical protein